MDPDDWGYFLCTIFDRWRQKDLGKVLVNHFETLVSQHMGLGSQICIYGEFCGKGVAVEHDGGVYSCDHYVYPEYRLGNLKDQALDTQVFSRTQVKFGYAKNETLPQYCRQCPYLTDCWGECPKNRIIRTPDGEPGLNYLCRGFKKYFAHAIPEVETDRRGPAPAAGSAPETDVSRQIRTLPVGKFGCRCGPVRARLGRAGMFGCD